MSNKKASGHFMLNTKEFQYKDFAEEFIFKFAYTLDDSGDEYGDMWVENEHNKEYHRRFTHLCGAYYAMRDKKEYDINLNFVHSHHMDKLIQLTKPFEYGSALPWAKQKYTEILNILDETVSGRCQ